MIEQQRCAFSRRHERLLHCRTFCLRPSHVEFVLGFYATLSERRGMEHKQRYGMYENQTRSARTKSCCWAAEMNCFHPSTSKRMLKRRERGWSSLYPYNTDNKQCSTCTNSSRNGQRKPMGRKEAHEPSQVSKGFQTSQDSNVILRLVPVLKIVKRPPLFTDSDDDKRDAKQHNVTMCNPTT